MATACDVGAVRNSIDDETKFGGEVEGHTEYVETGAKIGRRRRNDDSHPRLNRSTP